MVCIAASFTRHNRVAVHRLSERIDLVRYRIFDGGLLSLLLIESTSGSPQSVPSRRQQWAREGAGEAGAGNEKLSAQTIPRTVPACLRDLYAELDEALTACGEVEVTCLQHYIAYRRMVNLASVIFRPKHEAILVYLRLDPNTVSYWKRASPATCATSVTSAQATWRSGSPRRRTWRRPGR